jgi:site-specific DNA recombinase
VTTALVYVRQSRSKVYERSSSPEVQEAACRALPAVAACDEVEVFVDLDISGSGAKRRPGLAALLQCLEAGGVSVVAAYDQSRAFRNTRDALDFYSLMEKLPDVEVVFEHGRFDRTPVGGFSYTVLSAAHEMERKMSADKVRAAKHHAASLGEMVGAVPAGYLRHGDGSVTVDEATAPTIRRIFADYATGDVSTRGIARRLDAEGIRLPSFRSGWRADTVAQILGNPAYIAQTYSERRSKRLGERMPANWPAIIDRAVWDRVKANLSRFHRKGGRRQQGTGQERSYAFQGLLGCLDCGGRLHCHRLGGRNYYQCRGGRANGCRGVREDTLLAWMLGLWLTIDEDHDLVLSVQSAPKSNRPPDAVKKIDAAMSRLGQRFEWGGVSEAEYRAGLDRYRLLRAEAAADLEPTKPQRSPELPASFAEAWQRFENGSRRGLLAAVFEGFDIEGGALVGATLKAKMASFAAPLEKYRGCSPGGIRTRDLSLERAASWSTRRRGHCSGGRRWD